MEIAGYTVKRADRRGDGKEGAGGFMFAYKEGLELKLIISSVQSVLEKTTVDGYLTLFALI